MENSHFHTLILASGHKTENIKRQFIKQARKRIYLGRNFAWQASAL
jgi:hypothetical protein